MSLLPDLARLSLKTTGADNGDEEQSPKSAGKARMSPNPKWPKEEVAALRDAKATWGKGLTWAQLAEEWNRRYGAPGANPGWQYVPRNGGMLYNKWDRLMTAEGDTSTKRRARKQEAGQEMQAQPDAVDARLAQLSQQLRAPTVRSVTPAQKRRAQSPPPMSAPPRVDPPAAPGSIMPPPPPQPPPHAPNSGAFQPGLAQVPTIHESIPAQPAETADWDEDDQKLLEAQMDDSWLISKLQNPKAKPSVNWGVVYDAFIRERYTRGKSMATIKARGAPYLAVLQQREATADTLGVLAGAAASSSGAGGSNDPPPV